MIRTLREQDWEASLALTEFSFRLNLSDSERAKRLERMRTELTLGYYEEDTLAAKLVILPFQMYLGGCLMSMGGIASVATWPEHRRKGMVGQLLLQSLQTMRSQGQTISVLNPFSFDFYRKFGWGYFGEIKRYKFPVGKIPSTPLKKGKVERKTKEDVGQITDVYEAYAAKYNGMLSRDANWWERSVLRKKLGQMAVDYDECGQPRGYIMYSIVDKLLDVQEFIYLDEFSRMRLMRFLAMHDSMTENVTFTTPANDQFCALFDTPPAKTVSNVCYMARIVDFPAFLMQFPFIGDGREHSFLIRVEDRQAPWNHGIFNLTVSAAGIPEVNKLESPLVVSAQIVASTLEIAATAENEGTEVDIDGPIHIFSSLFMGYGSCSAYMESGFLSGRLEAAQTLDRLQPRMTPYLLDMF